AFVEILDGVEGLVHISELAQHHVENPRELVQQGDVVRVKILEIDSDRRRLSLSIKRVEGQVLPIRHPIEDGAGSLENMPELGLSEEVSGEPSESPASLETEPPPPAQGADAPEPSADAFAAPGAPDSEPSGEAFPAPEAADTPEPSGEAFRA